MLIRVTALILATGACLTQEPAASVFAGEPDAASKEALLKTKELLRSEELRRGAIQQSHDAQLVDAQIKALTGGGAGQEEIWGLSAEILEDLYKATGGDAGKMAAIVAEAQKDPKSIEKHLSPKNRQSIRDAAAKIKMAPKLAPNPSAAPR